MLLAIVCLLLTAAVAYLFAWVRLLERRLARAEWEANRRDHHIQGCLAQWAGLQLESNSIMNARLSSLERSRDWAAEMYATN